MIGFLGDTVHSWLDLHLFAGANGQSSVAAYVSGIGAHGRTGGLLFFPLVVVASLSPMKVQRDQFRQS
jgi:hypothetical protein